VPILDIVKQNFAIAHDDAADAITAKVAAGIEEVGLDADEWVPLLLLFLGVREGTERVAALTPETIKARTFEMLRQLSLFGSRRRTLILGVEDLHWVDKTSGVLGITRGESQRCANPPAFDAPTWISAAVDGKILCHSDIAAAALIRRQPSRDPLRFGRPCGLRAAC
jgi:hypothetical protein